MSTSLAVLLCVPFVISFNSPLLKLSLSLSLSPTLLPLPFYLFTHPLRHLFFSGSARVPFGLSPDPVPCDFLPGREKHALGGRLQLSSI